MTKGFSQTAVMLTAVLSQMTAQEAARVTNDNLATRVKRHRRTIGRALGELERAGWIRIERRRPNGAGVGTDPTGRTIVWVGAPAKNLDQQVIDAVETALTVVAS